MNFIKFSILVSSLVTISASASYSLRVLEGPEGSLGIIPSDMSADGGVISGYVNWGEFSTPFVYRNGEITYLPFNEPLSSAWGVSGNGQIVVGGSNAANAEEEAFRWLENQLVPLGDLEQGQTSSVAYAVSDDGRIIVGRGTGENNRRSAVRWEEGVIHDLGTLQGGLGSRAVDVSGNGLVIVGNSSSQNSIDGGGGMEAFLWRNGEMTGLGDLPGGSFHSQAHGISTDGSFILGFSASSGEGLSIIYEACYWKDGEIFGLGIPEGSEQSFAYDTPSDGSIIVGGGAGRYDYNTQPPEYVGFDQAIIWFAANGYASRSLNAILDEAGINRNGYMLERAVAVSEDGTIITGWGKQPNGSHVTFIVTIEQDGPFWEEYPVFNPEGDVNTGDWMGWINIKHAPWLFSYSLEGWLYHSSSFGDSAGSWFYIPR